VAADVSHAVLITGCSTGIGRATAKYLAERGLTVYATARKVDSVQDLEEHGCRVLQLDVTDEESMKRAVAAVEEQEGAVGALVNNAGYSLSGAVESVSMDEVRRQFETNVLGLIRMCQLVLPGMRRQRHGRIVNISSMGGKVTFPGGGVYHATKFAVEGLSDVLRWEVRGFGIDVSIIEPGLIRTEFGHTAVGALGRATETEGPYADFNAQVSATTEGAYTGAMSRMAAEPEAVARAIHKSVTRRRPKPRYVVTMGARVMIATRRMLPDRGWDAVMASQFKRPG
jgi:NAD(P)-dependent dehydrogenase (short-subunit alcohol dehydrogenase family)